MSFDETKAQDFAERLVSAMNEGSLMLMTSIGHRTRLFDTLKGMPPASSEVIAKSAGLNERYVREWLAAMVVGKFIEYDQSSDSYQLPDEHAAFLCRDSTPDNLAVFAQYFSVLGAVEDDIVRCFKEGGGVPYARFSRFHAVMAEDSHQTVVSSLLNHILPLVPGITERLQQGIRVADMGCGRGRALILMAEHFPNSEFIGYDFSAEAIANAKYEARSKNLSNLTFVAKDLNQYDKEVSQAQFDLVTTFDAVHDQPNPLALLKGIYQSLNADGVYLMQDIHSTGHVHGNMDHPIGPLLYTISCMHCMTVSLAQGGEGLGAMWGQSTAKQLLEQAGFNQYEIHQLPHDFQNDYYVIHK